MKLLYFVRPASEAKRQELERKLKIEKQRLLEATKEAKAAFLQDLPVIETAIAAMIGGIVVGMLWKARRERVN
ncbi:MAG: hypothetical protein P4M08_07820 [Oligoflexia bacterium]|nr:hypothetical protein [Oligoflexia bacterium]